MARGIQRLVIHFGEKSVKVRAQSKSLRGSSYTVGASEEAIQGEGVQAMKVAAGKAIRTLLQAPA